MQRQTINPRSASKSPKIASVTTTFTSVFSTFMLLLLLSVATINAQENCYINESGFTCCSKSLESAMKSAMTGGDLLGAADSIQKMAEGMLGGKFESVVSLDDFAHKHHFKEGKSCKVEKDGKYAAAWQP